VPASLTKCLSRILLERSRWAVVLLQACLILFSLVLAWLLRFDFTLPYRTILLFEAPVLILIRVSAMASFGLLHGWWRYTGVSDIFDVLKAVILGSVLFFLVNVVILGVTKFPRSVYILEGLLTAGFLAGVRLLSRANAESVREDISSSKRVAIVGAGFAAQMLLREIRHHAHGYLAVACVDDDASKLRLKVQGVPVMGTVDDLPGILQAHPVDEIFIAIPSATAQQMDRIVSICERTGARFRTVPALRDFISGQSAFAQLRDVNLEDLLSREPVELDLESVRNHWEGQTVLVTGAAGSIGSELCRQILYFHPRSLVCVDQNETAMFHLHRELALHGKETPTVFMVADVADRERMFRLLNEHRPSMIVHAASYKHVPLLEENAGSAVANNVFALLDLLEAAEATCCSTFILISSDKAVQPTSVMGATKRVCELIISCRPSRGVRGVSVRFGNVLGSNGSVVPVLQEQLRKNRELTITHPEMTRFFMTVREAASLVLQATAIGRHGDILVLDMNQPVRIVDLAHNLIRLSGRSMTQVKLRFTGLRPGEKLHEQLFYPSEVVFPTSSPKIRRACAELLSWNRLEGQLVSLRQSLNVDGSAPVRAALKAIVPEYSYHPEVRSHGSSRHDGVIPARYKALARAVGRG
jgi:FlaA1/EpsC-like NDP-sugar epimerase